MISVHLDNTRWRKLQTNVEAVGTGSQQFKLAMTRALNHTGNKARTQMKRTLAQQTGLKIKTTDRALKTKRAFGGSAFVIWSQGGNVRLQFFGARETRKGVIAAPWNRRKTFAGAFMRGGKFPNRKDIGLGGAVVRRAGASRYPMKTQKSGLFIPNEMVTGQTEGAFYNTAERELPPRMMHELRFLFGKL